MRVVSFSLLLLVGCSTVKWPVEYPLISQSKPVFQNTVQAVVAPPKVYYLVWSNPNPYYVTFQIDSIKTNKVNMTNWSLYAVGTHNPLSETNIQIYLTNSHEFFRVGFR